MIFNDFKIAKSFNDFFWENAKVKSQGILNTFIWAKTAVVKSRWNQITFISGGKYK